MWLCISPTTNTLKRFVKILLRTQMLIRSTQRKNPCASTHIHTSYRNGAQYLEKLWQEWKNCSVNILLQYGCYSAGMNFLLHLKWFPSDQLPWKYASRCITWSHLSFTHWLVLFISFSLINHVIKLPKSKYT